VGIFDGIFNTAPQQQAAADQTRGIQAGYSDLSGLFGQGRDALTTNFTAGLSPFLTNYSKFSGGTDALNDALGVNGAQGNARATAAFQNHPGYEFAKQQGIDAILANQAKTGQLASGNTNLDLSKWVTNNANQNWNNYVSQLQPFLGASNTAAGGVLSGYGGLGSGLNSSFMGQGNAAYGANTSIGNANANADLAKSGANANILGGLLGLGGLFLSDERAKEDIEPIGELYDGQEIYRFKYKGDDAVHVGLIAQEVEERDPGAVVEFPDGLKRVDYARATNFAADLGRYLEAA
jgi:Chaperone of endosialidase